MGNVGPTLDPTEVQDSNHSNNSVYSKCFQPGFIFPFTMAQPAQGVVAPEGYHEPSLQRKDADASSHLRQMMNGEWRLKFNGGESGETLGCCGDRSSYMGNLSTGD